MPARRRLLPVLFLPVFVLAVCRPPARAGALVDARAELRELTGLLRDAKATNDQLLAALDAVAKVYDELPAPPEPAYEAVPVGAAPAVARGIRRRNLALARRYAAEVKAFERVKAAFRSDADKQLLKALQLVRRKDDANLRDPVNVKAARILGRTTSERTAARLIRAIQTSIVDPEHEVSVELTEEAFAALGHQGHESSLDWLVEKYTHTMNSPPRAVELLVAAQKALLLFPREAISARGRFNTVKKLVTSYAGVESTALKSGASAADRSAKQLWDRIRDGVIRALQYYAGSPKNAKGEVLATVAEFQDWLRHHRNLRRMPWSA